MMNNLYPLLTGNYKEGVTDLDRLITPALMRIVRKKYRGYQKKFRYPDLTAGQKAEVRKYFGKYERVNLLCHRVFTGCSGKFHPEYISEEMYYRRIEPYYSDRLASKYLDNKCFYYRFFSSVKQPELYAMRIKGRWLDGHFRPISLEEAASIVGEQEKSVFKHATFSECGYGVYFLDDLNPEERQRRFMELAKAADPGRIDLVVQAAIDQHPAYAALHPSSVNTLRIISLLTKEGVKILASAVRIGAGDSRVDNLGYGGVLCCIHEDGSLGELGIRKDGTATREHPELHYQFDGIRLPYYHKAVEIVKRAHGIMGHNRFAHWDVAIDSSGEAVLIETNMAMGGGIDAVQESCGPLLGKYTREVLDEVYFRPDGRRRHKPYCGMNERKYFRLRDNLLAITAAYYKAGYTQIVLLCNAALRRLDRKAIRAISGSYPELTQEEIRAIRRYYDPYVKNVHTSSHRMYKAKSGVFHVDYVPEEMFLCDIDRYLSDRDMAYYLGNKCYQYRLFPDAKQPEAVAMRIGPIWVDRDYQPISPKEVLRKVFAAGEVVIKGAQGSEGGADVHFHEIKKDRRESLKEFRSIIRSLKRDIVIQRTIRQHPDLARLHPESVNTYRIISLLLEKEVVILSCSLKVGAGKHRVDNGCSGGFYCGIDSSDRLRKIGSLDNGTTTTVHPDLGYTIEGIHVPALDQCKEMVKRCHPFMAYHRLISWDIAVDDTGDPVLIEANLCLGGSDDTQCINGPFFGKYNHRILDEVYHKQ